MNADIIVAFLRTMSDIITAGVAITGFSLLIYAFTFNMRIRVTWTLALILLCLVATYSAEAFATISSTPADIELWLRLQWVGIVFLPAVVFHFSDSILALTGKPSRGKRRVAVFLGYLAAIVFLGLLSAGLLFGEVVTGQPVSYVMPNLQTSIFEAFFILVMAASWYNLARAVGRATTVASRRRLGYVLLGSFAPLLGTFPFLPLSPELPTSHPLVFWSLAFYSNFIVIILIVLMAYSVAFFGSTQPDRVIRARLVRWLLRGPITASLTLGVVTLLNRAARGWEWKVEILVPVAMVASILLFEHLITILTPWGERWFMRRGEKVELQRLQRIESRLLTRQDLTQFLELILSGISDLTRGQGGYVVSLRREDSELVLELGRNRFQDTQHVPVSNGQLQPVKEAAEGKGDAFVWEEDLIFPLFHDRSQEEPVMVGLLGLTEATLSGLDADQRADLSNLIHRAEVSMRDWQVQENFLRALDATTGTVTAMQRLRAASELDRMQVFSSDESLGDSENLLGWVRDALGHFWGGPRLTDSPLMNFRIVREAAAEYDGNQANALRAVLRKAIDQVKPDGDRRFTAEWILYNILEMKFVEGKKVREVALRLAMSEADLYRKQRVAIEAVARAIAEMEGESHPPKPPEPSP